MLFFANGGSSYLASQKDMVSDSHYHCLSLDWAVDIGEARKQLGVRFRSRAILILHCSWVRWMKWKKRSKHASRAPAGRACTCSTSGMGCCSRPQKERPRLVDAGAEVGVCQVLRVVRRTPAAATHWAASTLVVPSSSKFNHKGLMSPRAASTRPSGRSRADILAFHIAQTVVRAPKRAGLGASTTSARPETLQRQPFSAQQFNRSPAAQGPLPTLYKQEQVIRRARPAQRPLDAIDAESRYINQWAARAPRRASRGATWRPQHRAGQRREPPAHSRGRRR